jgi:hypothetical protein
MGLISLSVSLFCFTPSCPLPQTYTRARLWFYCFSFTTYILSSILDENLQSVTVCWALILYLHIFAWYLHLYLRWTLQIQSIFYHLSFAQINSTSWCT